MAIWAIVPVKPFKEAKSRLSAVLPSAEREQLSRELMTHTLRVLAQLPTIARTLVVSRDPAALALARKFDAHTVSESKGSGLNLALSRAIAVASALGAGAVLILPADLPMLVPAEVEALLENDGPGKRVVLSSDRRGQGTNALFMRPAGVLKVAFGPASFIRHVTLSKQAGVEVEICRQAGIEFDLDLPDDLRLYREMLKARADGVESPEAQPRLRKSAGSHSRPPAG